MRSNIILFALIPAVVFAGLADPLFASIRSEEKVLGEPREDQALVYLMREGHYVGKARTMFVYADETFLGVLENKSYTFAYLDPGEHMLWLNWAKVNDEIEVVAGEAVPRQIPDEIAETLGEGVFDEIARAATSEAAEGTVILSGEITQYKPGSESSRMMMAGTGSSHLDFSVTLVDANSGKELSRFSGKRTWAWGGGHGASRGIADLEQNVAYEIALYLKRCKMGEGAELEDAAGDLS